MKTTLRIPTKTTYAYIEVELNDNELITLKVAQRIVANYLNISKVYYAESEGIKIAEKNFATKDTMVKDVKKEEINELVNKIEKETTVEGLAIWEPAVFAIEDSKSRDVVMKKYNDKKIKIIDQQ